MVRGLGEYFNQIADILASRAELGGDSVENVDIGTNREAICRELLQKHMPKRFMTYLGGDVFGVGGTRSGQIDILVNHDMSINFLENYKIRCPVESVTAAIAVKSKLTKKEIFSALSNLATIPPCHPSVVKLPPYKNTFDNYAMHWPALFVFAYDGVECKTCIQHIVEFYLEHDVPLSRIPRAVIVNRKYIVSFLHHEVDNALFEAPFSPAYVKSTTVADSTRGHPLFWMMIELAKGLTWLDGLYLDYGAYYHGAFV